MPSRLLLEYARRLRIAFVCGANTLLLLARVRKPPSLPSPPGISAMPLKLTWQK